MLGTVEGDRVVHLAGYGRVDDSGRAVTPQAPFLLAAVSEPLTASAGLEFVDSTEVQLDAPGR